MDVLVVVDMQEAVLEGDPKHDRAAVVGRIDRLASRVRGGGGRVLVAVADCHAVAERPHLSAERVIEQHHCVWANVIARHPVNIACTAEIG